MAIITVSVNDEVYLQFRRLAAQERQGKKGFLGEALTELMLKHNKERDQIEARDRLLARLKTGYKMGGLTRTFAREDLHERS